MKHDEVAYALPFEIALAVELVDGRLVGRGVREQPDKADRRRLDQVNARRFQRLQEPRREAERDAIAVPHLAPLAARETKAIGVSELLTIEVREEQLFGALVIDVLARINKAVAGAMLKADAPLPSRLPRRRAREGMERFGTRAGNRHRPVARQPVAPILKTGLQRLLDEESAKSRAIDEEVRLDDLPAFE